MLQSNDKLRQALCMIHPPPPTQNKIVLSLFLSLITYASENFLEGPQHDMN